MVTFSWIVPAAAAACLLVVVSAEGARANSQGLNHHHHQAGRATPQDNIAPGLLARAISPTGNWTNMDCTDKLIQHPYDYNVQERWFGLGADDAWNDVVKVWNTSDYSTAYDAFRTSVANTLGTWYVCGGLTYDCNESLGCSDLTGRGDHLTGPAALLVWQSLVAISDMYRGYANTLQEAINNFNHTALFDMESTFAPAAGEIANGTWAPLLAELINLGPLALFRPYVFSTVKLLPWFSDKPADIVDRTIAPLISLSVAIAKTAPLSDQDNDWTRYGFRSGSRFPGLMSRAIFSWREIGTLARKQQFNGSAGSVAILGEAMADGKFVEQAKWPIELPFVPARPNLVAPLAKTFFGFTIPTLWRLSGTYAFVLDSGAACDVAQPLTQYLDAATTNATGACVDGKRYFLVHPGGSASNGNAKFTTPPGLDKLPFYNNITVEDLVRGSLRSWIPGGGNGTGTFADPTTNATAADAMLDGEVPGPGVVRLPVCSAESAMRGWQAGPGVNVTAVYPCAGAATSAGERLRYPGAAAAAVVVLGLALVNVL